MKLITLVKIVSYHSVSNFSSLSQSEKSKNSTIWYGSRKCETLAHLFAQILAHRTSKKEISQINRELRYNINTELILMNMN